MTSTAFSIPRDPQQFVSVHKRAANASGATSQAAEEAIRQVIEQRRHRNKYGAAPEPKESLVGGFTAALGEAVNDSVRRFGLPMWLVRVGVAAVVVIVLGSAVLLRGGPVTRHTVDGTVVFEGRPLANARLAFHKTGPDSAEPITLTADASGGFRSSPDVTLPAGLYAIVVQPATVRAKKPLPIPKAYADPTNTPLRVLVTEDLVGLKLLVRR